MYGAAWNTFWQCVSARVYALHGTMPGAYSAGKHTWRWSASSRITCAQPATVCCGLKGLCPYPGRSTDSSRSPALCASPSSTSPAASPHSDHLVAALQGRSMLEWNVCMTCSTWYRMVLPAFMAPLPLATQYGRAHGDGGSSTVHGRLWCRMAGHSDTQRRYHEFMTVLCIVWHKARTRAPASALVHGSASLAAAHAW
jgi:hypothetical protein